MLITIIFRLMKLTTRGIKISSVEKFLSLGTETEVEKEYAGKATLFISNPSLLTKSKLSNHHAVYLKYMQFSFVNYTSIKMKK